MAAFDTGTFTLGSLIGLGIGTFLGHALAIRRGKGLVKHNAGIEFRKAINPALDKLENGENQFNVIQDSFDTHYQAAITFSSYLGGKELESFKKTLKEYKHWQSTMYGSSREEVMYDTEDPEYLEVKAIKPIKFLKELLRHVNT